MTTLEDPRNDVELEGAPRTVVPSKRPAIITELHAAITEHSMSMVDIAWEQQRLHESRRWSVMEMLAAVDMSKLTDLDRNLVWNLGRAELTTKPGADRLERQTRDEVHRWRERNPVVASIMEACGTWSRYWNEEEAHHETSLLRLAWAGGMSPIPDDTFFTFRQVFPDDDMLRTLVLLAFSEITAAVNYGQCQLMSKDEGLTRLFKQIAADEIQHRNYFVSFAKALVDTGEYPAKDAFSVGHLFLREDGEMRGSTRTKVEDRTDTHVNWWDHLDTEGTGFKFEAFEKKEQLICGSLQKITGIETHSAEEVEDAWLDLV